MWPEWGLKICKMSKKRWITTHVQSNILKLNSPFHSCVKSKQAFVWNRGVGWPCTVWDVKLVIHNKATDLHFKRGRVCNTARPTLVSVWCSSFGTVNRTISKIPYLPFTQTLTVLIITIIIIIYAKHSNDGWDFFNIILPDLRHFIKSLLTTSSPAYVKTVAQTEIGREPLMQ